MLNLPNSLGLPSPQFLGGYFEKWSPDESEFMGKMLLPTENWDYPDVRWDELAGVAGMASAHALDAAPPSVAARERKTRVEVPFYFGDQMELNESDFLHIRALGTFNRMAGRELVLDQQKQMVVRTATREEWARWQAFGGSIAVDENGVKRTLTYPTKSISAPSTLWSVVASANPIANVQGWALLFRGHGMGKLQVWFNQQVAAYLAQNAIVRDLVKANPLASNVGTDNIVAALNILVGDAEFHLYDGGHTDMAGNYTPFIPDNKVVLVKRPPNGQQLGAFRTTPSVRNGGPFNPRPGRFAWVEDKTANSSCPKYTHGHGIYGLPVLFFPQNVASVTVA